MKRIKVLILLVLCLAGSANADDLKQGAQLTKSLELEFDDLAVESEAYITWELDGDWDKFEYSFSQGELDDNLFTVYAADYRSFVNGQEGIALTIAGKSKTKQDVYKLNMNVLEVSDELDFDKTLFNLNLQVNYILPPPTPIWKKLLIGGIILLSVILILVLLLNFLSKFPRGILQLGSVQVDMRGKKRISAKEELNNAGISTYGDSDVIFTKKMFGSFQGPVVKQMIDCDLYRSAADYLSTDSTVYSGDVVKGLKDSNGKDIVIAYA